MRATVLDSYALLAFLRAETGSEVVRGLLEKASDRNEYLHMTEVNYAEVQYVIRRKDGIPAWEQIARELPTLPIAFHPATRDLADVAAELKSRFSISLADAFAAALAKTKRAELVTGDPEFEPLKDAVKIRWLKA